MEFFKWGRLKEHVNATPCRANEVPLRDHRQLWQQSITTYYHLFERILCCALPSTVKYADDVSIAYCIGVIWEVQGGRVSL